MNEDACQFIAAYSGHRTDKEGTTKITLEVPESELPNVIQMLRFREQAFYVTVILNKLVVPHED